MAKSKIEWTETTWNPVTGCTKISTGCLNCYAERMAYRLQMMGSPKYRNGFDVTCHKDSLLQPFDWKTGRMVFVNSMSDLFHADVSFEFIAKVFNTMTTVTRHHYQVLTKRSDRLLELADRLPWTENILMGVSIEDNDSLIRVQDLIRTPAAVKFLSCEPLIGPLETLDLTGIDWVIVGGESGPKARPISKAWVEDIHMKCNKTDVPFFFKQWGGTNKKKTGRLLNGRIWEEMPRRLESVGSQIQYGAA